jgi:excinuclease ABC subunit B
VAILDADKEGFLRSETSLIQTIGRAARNAQGLVILYADTVTRSMSAAMEETQRRREIQSAYNQAHGIVPKTIVKSVRDVLEISHAPAAKGKGPKALSDQEKAGLIAQLEAEMKEASRRLEFEYAAVLRDQIIALQSKETPGGKEPKPRKSKKGSKP